MPYYGSAITPDVLTRLKKIESQRLATTGQGLRPEDWQAAIQTGIAGEVQRQAGIREFGLQEAAITGMYQGQPTWAKQAGEAAITGMYQGQPTLESQKFAKGVELTEEKAKAEERAATISGVGTLITAGKTAYDWLVGEEGGGGIGAGTVGTGGGLLGKILGPGEQAIEKITTAAPLVGKAITAGAPAIGAGAMTVAEASDILGAMGAGGAAAGAGVAGFTATTALEGLTLEMVGPELTAGIVKSITGTSAVPAAIETTAPSLLASAGVMAGTLVGAYLFNSFGQSPQQGTSAAVEAGNILVNVDINDPNISGYWVYAANILDALEGADWIREQAKAQFSTEEWNKIMAVAQRVKQEAQRKGGWPFYMTPEVMMTYTGA